MYMYMNSVLIWYLCGGCMFVSYLFSGRGVFNALSIFYDGDYFAIEVYLLKVNNRTLESFWCLYC